MPSIQLLPLGLMDQIRHGVNIVNKDDLQIFMKCIHSCGSQVVEFDAQINLRDVMWMQKKVLKNLF